MQHDDTLSTATGKNAAVSQRTTPASTHPGRRTSGTRNWRRRRLVDGFLAFFGEKTPDAKPGADKAPGKHEPFPAFYCAAVVAFAVLTTVGAAQAGDMAHQRGAPADIKGWIDGLANQAGANCCSDADGVQPQEVVWEIGRSQYRVRVRDTWIDVPETAVIHGPNYLGHAVVWIYEDLLLDDAYEDVPYVRCFLPGPAS